MRIWLRIIYNLVTNPIKAGRVIKQIRGWIRDEKINPIAPAITNRKLWEKRSHIAIIERLGSSFIRDMLLETIKSFYNSRITCLKNFQGTVSDDEIILITAVKNDCSRLNHFLTHYRMLGIKRFVFIDNGSADKTVEKILEQEDTACYQTDYKFSAANKAGWFNRIAAHYGIKRWYVIVDSDELLAYPEMNKIPVSEYVQTAQNKGLSCIKTVMLDVYPDGPLMDESKTDEEYLGSCVYFDRGDKTGHTGSYVYNAQSNEISGGMRVRLFPGNTEINLTKPALLHFTGVYFVSTHMVSPKPVDLSAPYGGAVLHHKFLPSDRIRYIENAREEHYYDGSSMYKIINNGMEQTPKLSAMAEISVKFDTKDAWKYLPFVRNIIQS